MIISFSVTRGFESSRWLIDVRNRRRSRLEWFEEARPDSGVKDKKEHGKPREIIRHKFWVRANTDSVFPLSESLDCAVEYGFDKLCW